MIRRKGSAQVQNNLPKNVSSPIIVSPVLGIRTPHTGQGVRVRKKAVYQLDNPHSAFLRQKLANTDNCCSDSEVTAKPPKSNNRIRPNLSFNAASEKTRPLSLPLHQNHTSTSDATSTLSPSVAHTKNSSRPKSLNSATSNQSFENSSSTPNASSVS